MPNELIKVACNNPSCKRLFGKKSSNHKYCSTKCAQAVKYKRRHNNFDTRECDKCNAIFVPTLFHQNTCGTETCHELLAPKQPPVGRCENGHKFKHWRFKNKHWDAYCDICTSRRKPPRGTRPLWPSWDAILAGQVRISPGQTAEGLRYICGRLGF